MRPRIHNQYFIFGPRKHEGGNAERPVIIRHQLALAPEIAGLGKFGSHNVPLDPRFLAVLRFRPLDAGAIFPAA